VEIPIIAQRPWSLQCTVDGPIAAGTALSAGAHTVVVGQHLPSGRDRTATPLVVGLRPVLTAAVAANLARAVPADAASPVFGDIDLTGVLLGAPHDDAVLALYRDGATVRMLDTFTAPPPPVAPQTRVLVSIPADQAVSPGRHRLILRVNGQQARSSPSVDLTMP
jgi:hypothetical protein